MSDQLRAGIVGAGFIAGVHARAVRAAGGLVQRVAASTTASTEDAVRRIGGALPAATAEELIDADDVDVVHICTPNATHLAFAQRALAVGKHVICEKPLAVGAGQARTLARAAASTAALAAVPFVYRYYPSVREARARIAAGDAGPLHLLHGSYLQDWMSSRLDMNWRVDPERGGPSRTFADIGVHWCDLMEFTTGHRVTRLCARTPTAYVRRGPATVRTEDAALVLFETDRGAAGSMVASQISAGRKNRLWFSFDGADAAYVFDQELPETLWIGGREQSVIVHRGESDRFPDVARLSLLPPGHPQGYQDCFNAFVADAYAAARCDSGNGGDGLPSFADGARAAAITEAVLRSAAEERWIEVSP
ncbi:MAG: Gfo/Idh/MocA family protein [Sciscionella sp.]